MKPAPARRPTRVRSYFVLYLLFAVILIGAHLPLLDLPYFWDEAGQFVPAALDVLQKGALVPRSAVPNIHPPAIPAYLAGAWRLGGYRPATTRIAMLALSAAGLLAAFLLAIELSRNARGTPAFLAASFLCVSPVFFAQSMLAQLDAPAMLFTALALLLFLQDRILASMAACVVLVCVKETGAIVPAVFLVWLAWERRWRDAALFLLPMAVLGGWLAVLKRQTGHWAGNDDFAVYNVWYPLHPLRMAATLARRLYFVLGANFHWIGAAAAIYAWRKTPLFRGRSWRIAGALLAAHIVAFTVLGGAVLNRYLLPALPIVFAAMAASLSVAPRFYRRAGQILLLAGLCVSNFVNPPYPFPFEENLAFVDFVKLHRDAADYIAHWFEDPVVQTAWPMSAELSRPELGYAPRKIRVEALPDMSPSTLAAIDWNKAQIVVVFSRDWEPEWNITRLRPFNGMWRNLYGFVPGATAEESRARVPFPVDATFQRRGQWVDVYVNPDLPRIPRAEPRVAGMLYRSPS